MWFQDLGGLPCLVMTDRCVCLKSAKKDRTRLETLQFYASVQVVWDLRLCFIWQQQV